MDVHRANFDRPNQAIQQARMDKGLSQKDCAQKINEKPSVLQDYESGKAIPNTQILSKLERVLGVKLRGTLTSHCLCHIAYTVVVRYRNWKEAGGSEEVVDLGPSTVAIIYLRRLPSNVSIHRSSHNYI